MVQLPRKFVVMDVVIIDVPSTTYGMILSNHWGNFMGELFNLTYLMPLYLSLRVILIIYIKRLVGLLRGGVNP
jgi:hypothetical protein